MVDPVFLHQLAVRLGMPVGEMCNRMSAHELCVEWPLFFEVEAYLQQEELKAQEKSQRIGGGPR